MVSCRRAPDAVGAEMDAGGRAVWGWVQPLEHPKLGDLAFEFAAPCNTTRLRPTSPAGVCRSRRGPLNSRLFGVARGRHKTTWLGVGDPSPARIGRFLRREFSEHSR